MTDHERPPDLTTRTEGEGETIDLPEGMQGFTSGQVLGERYQILEMLGRGGMGEVWHAFDLKLRVEVALKALRPEFFKSERRLELLRQEVRAAREVVSPNVCRIFDLVEVEGRELVSMEYVDGATLLGVLQERGPLELKEAQDIASQFLAGLEAIHKAGLIHRDIKPENIMLTRAGRVVVMDFGLARQETEGGGTVAGTPAYMSPEQAAGQTLDARADVYAAGVVLAEMVSPEGIKSFDSRQSVWEGVRSEPTKIPDTPWAPVIKQAVKKDREGRYKSAHTLTRALEDVTLRVEGADDLHPYPGLASFTEADAEYFFGREAEVEQMWRKLERPHLLAVVGPSGAGKTSFLRAGFFPSAGPGWRIARCTPGTAPLTALREVLAAELSGDADVMRLLVRGDDADALVEAFTGWRKNHTQALLVIDQFEELFTLNPPDVQHAIAGILRRLVIEADIFVLLSFRDDFLARCREHEAFSSVFTDLTVLLAPTGAALRRALTQPALQCGYRFEDDELVEEMLAEVEGERGALPLLAFAAARLWERRDKESGLLTREAYQEIGGVGGALAQHAEATIDRIGVERIPIVRELFRNLVTAEGTRAVREWNELLSIFDDALRESAAEVLRELVDARLLTSYEVHEDEQEPTSRVEIIHESLLANWPRLVRWQTQDQEGVQLRDELRQAARSWDEHDRQDDRMWTGTAFREYQLWRERYPGGLTDLEEAFAAAMTSLATRRKRRRRIAAVVGVAVLLVVLAVVTGLWRRSVLETRRAEASKLLTLGHAALAEERTEALAYSIASLELSDIPEARRLALRALWAGPPATAIPDGEGAWGLAFAPDGRQIAVGYSGGLIRVFPQRGGAPVEVHGLDGKGIVGPLRYSPDGRLLTGYASAGGPDVRIWETTGWQTERILPAPGAHGALGFFDPNGHDIITLGFHLDGPRLAPGERYGRWLLHRWAVDGEEPELIGMTEGTQAPIALPLLSRDVLAVGTRDVVALHHLETLGRKPGRLIARYPEVFALNSTIAFDPKADRLALADSAGHLDLWRLDGDGEQPEREIVAPRNPMFTAFSPDGSHLAYVGSGVRLWSLHGPISAEPLVLDPGRGQCNEVAFSPDGRWLVGSGGGLGLTLWPLTDRYSRILRSHEGGVAFIVFSPDGSRLITQGSNDGTVLAWDLSGGAGLEPVVLYKDTPQWGWGLAMDPMERFLIVGDLAGIRKVALDGTAITPIANFPRLLPELSPAGRLVAANVWLDGRTPTMVVLDLDTEERWEFDPPGEGEVSSWRFDPSGRLLMTRGGVLSRWNPSMNSTDVLVAAGATDALPLPDGRRLIVNIDGTRRILDLEDGSSTPLPRAHQPPGPIVLDSSGSIVVSGHPDGEIRVSSLSDENVHLLLGHDGFVTDLGVSPDGRWIASLADGAPRLWPIPDLSMPPLHSLSHEEFVAKLKALTNLRAVPDADSYTGYTIEADPTAYRGWAVVPTW